MARFFDATDVVGKRVRVMGGVWLLVGVLLLARLFYIQVLQHGAYSRQASGVRAVSQTIKAQRGEIFSRDARDGQSSIYPIALNRDQMMLVSDNRKITDTVRTRDAIIAAAQLSKEDGESVDKKLTQKNRAYQILIKDVSTDREAELRRVIIEAELVGLYFDRQPARFYPERDLLAHITGFVGRTEKGEPIGRYGVEGYFDERLAGTHGFVTTEKDPFGGWIPVADRDFDAARDGDDLIVTIDRVLQLKLCEALERGRAQHSARSASGVIMDPHTGAVLAMCSLPTFDPNEYQKTENTAAFNNRSIFVPFEPGSVFKIVTMAAALDAEAITPDTTFTDVGFVKRDGFTIRNAAEKKWGTRTMTDVIKESINTGTVFAAEKLGSAPFRGYVEKFGFGAKTGVELKTEEKGNTKSLTRTGSVFLATGSFGQGITTTPLQLVQAFGAIANDGVMVRPTVVHAWRSPDGVTTYQKPSEVRRVVSVDSARAAAKMLRTVVEEGHGKAARVAGYSVVGKTGTAQIAGANGKYTADNNHTFIGFAPASDPRFVMLITYEAPAARFAETTAVPTFGEVAKFLLEYLGVRKDAAQS